MPPLPPDLSLDSAPFDPWRELPPTAGLPLQARDLLGGWGADRDFAHAAAAFLGVEELVLTCSGTAALVVALTTLKRTSARTQVIVPGFTCPLVAIAVAHCGLELVLCDLTPDGIDMDAAALAALIGPETLAVVPTHLAGRVADLDSVLRLAAHHGAIVIEDAAQALGARIDGRPVGTLGDIGFYSLAVGKGLTLYEGGLMYARDPALRAALAETARELLPVAPLQEIRRSLELAAYALFYRPRLLPFAYGRGLRQDLRRGDAIGAAGDYFGRDIPLHRVGDWRQGVGTRALTRLPAFLEAGRVRAHRIAARLSGIAGITLVMDPAGADGVWPSFLLRLPDSERRDRALKRLWGAGLGVSRLFVHALPDYPFLTEITPRIALPHARQLAATSLLIGNSEWLAERDLDVLERHLRGL